MHPFKNSKGQLVHVSPHWAKKWEGVKVHGKLIKDYLRQDGFKEQIVLYRGGLPAAVKSGGYSTGPAYTLEEDADALFSTKLSLEMFGDDWETIIV